MATYLSTSYEVEVFNNKPVVWSCDSFTYKTVNPENLDFIISFIQTGGSIIYLLLHQLISDEILTDAVSSAFNRVEWQKMS